MTRTITDGILATTDAPWFLAALLTCPKCGCTFYLTAEDFQPMAGPFGASDTIWHWWRELTEGDPATAPLDLSNYHLDPAQVSGPCPQCFYPVTQRGPRYGTTKITTIDSDPATGDIPGYIAAGATQMLWYEIEESGVVATDLAGCFATPTGSVVGAVTDSNGLTATAPAVARVIGPNLIDTHWTMLFYRPNRNVDTSRAALLDPSLVEAMERYGLIV